jgi:hypothetical protein
MHVQVGTVSATLSNARRALAVSLGEPVEPDAAPEETRHG